MPFPPNPDRRRLLGAGLALGAGATLPLLARASSLLPAPAPGGRVVIVGGGWGGLAAARRLRELAPQLEVVLLERNTEFHSCPLSNRWLAGKLDGRLLRHDYAAAAKAYGYTFLRTEVTAVDRDRREVRTADGTLAYDWLLLAIGIGEDYGSWFGNAADAATEAREKFGSAWQPGQQQALKARLDAFAGGDFVMTVPPMPYRCPPAPFERACMIATLFRQRNIKARVIVLDPNPMMRGFDHVFNGAYSDRIVYVPQAELKAVDPFAKTVTTDFETFRFADAILMPPQRAGDLAMQSGLLGHDANDASKPGRWAALDPLSFRSAADPRIFVVGDMIDRVSLLFGHYPKTGQIAAHQGRIAAARIAAEATGKEAARELPASTCFVYAGAEPMEMIRIETRYRLRGDGLIMQMVNQHYNAQPQDEDIAWATGMYREMLAG